MFFWWDTNNHLQASLCMESLFEEDMRGSLRNLSYAWKRHCLWAKCHFHVRLNLWELILRHIPLMKGSHSLGRPFKMVIATSASSTMSTIASNCSLIWDTLMKYYCIVSGFWIFTPLSWFLKVILMLMFFPSNSSDNASNISFRVVFENTWGTKWTLMESAMILLALTISFLCFAFASSPSAPWTYSLM